MAAPRAWTTTSCSSATRPTCRRRRTWSSACWTWRTSSPGEYLIDLGSGDGRIAITAAQRGARAYGVDLNPERVKEAIANAAKAGVSDRATFEVRDLFKTDISKADVVTTYLLPLVNLDLRPRMLEQMRPGARIVAHAFHMGDDWWPDATDNIRGRVLFSWVVPAKVGGRWQVESEDGDFVLDIEQTFQYFTAAAHVDRRPLPKVVEAAHDADPRRPTQRHRDQLRGRHRRRAARLRGRVEGDTIRGIAPQGWKATRISK